LASHWDKFASTKFRENSLRDSGVLTFLDIDLTGHGAYCREKYYTQQDYMMYSHLDGHRRERQPPVMNVVIIKKQGRRQQKILILIKFKFILIHSAPVWVTYSTLRIRQEWVSVGELIGFY
jgi:hypothetical protein